MPWIRNGAPTMVPIVCRGLSAEYGSWKTIAMSRRSGRSVAGGAVGDVLALELHPAAGRLEQPCDQPAGGGLAAPRLADQRQRLPAQHLEVQPVHGAHRADLALQQPPADREVLLQLRHAQQGPRLVGSARRCLAGRSSPSPGRHSHVGTSSLDDPPPLVVVEVARDAVPRPDGVQLGALGLGPPAGQLAVAAPRVERAPRRRVEQARRVAGDRHEPAVAARSKRGTEPSRPQV